MSSKKKKKTQQKNSKKINNNVEKNVKANLEKKLNEKEVKANVEKEENKKTEKNEKKNNIEKNKTNNKDNKKNNKDDIKDKDISKGDNKNSSKDNKVNDNKKINNKDEKNDNKKIANKNDNKDNSKSNKDKKIVNNSNNKDETKEEKVIFKNKEKKNNEKKKKNTENVKDNKKSETAQKEILTEKENNKRKAGFILITLISILLIVLIFSTIFAMMYSTKNTIAKGVMIKNIDISGLTYDQAKQKLEEAFNTTLDLNIELYYKDYLYSIKPDDIEFSYNLKKQLDEAYSIGRKGNIIECNYNLIATAIMKKNINFEYNYNKDDINSIVDEVSTSIPGLVSQYSYYIEENNLIINKGVDGIEVEKDKLKELIINNLKNRNPLDIIKDFKNARLEIPYKNVKANDIDIDKIYSEVYSEPKDAYFIPATETEKTKIFADSDGVDFAISIDEAKEKLKEETNEYIIPIVKKKANVTINDIGLEAFPNKLQEFSTRYDASLYGRSENLRIATSKIDGTVLMPGQQFSFNGVVGERTVQEGYKNAAIFAGDSVVDGLAGGICQVSSTLYNAALLSNLQIDERYNHSFKTSYLEVGRDATVVYGVKDLKFTNNRSYPIKIEGSSENGVVNFAIYGIEEDTEYKINIIPVITSTIPYTVQTITDNTLAPGSQRVDQAGSSGYRVTTYKETVLNGAVISKEQISNDIYKAMNRIVRVGPTMVSAPAPATPSPETPTPEQVAPAQ